MEETVASTGDWRAAIDGLRPVTSQLWRGLSEADKRRFIAEDARSWDVHRHRMAPATSRRLDAVAAEGRLVRHRGTLAAVRADRSALHVTLDDGTTLRVAAVVNCTGPVGSIAADPLLTRLAQSGLVRPGPAGLGIDTADDGRILGTLPDTLPFLAVGSLRRGNLWESTAMPEIREQAYDVARIVSRSLHGEARRRPVDPYGLTLSTSQDAAERYNAALGRLLRLQDGVEEGLADAVAADEGFVQAHAALALLGHEWGANTHWRASLRAAHRAAADRHLDDRESSFLDAVTTRLRTDEATGAAALLRHVRLFPRDALAVSVAVPTVAFGGLTSGTQTAELVESLGRSYGDDWWYAGQLAFVRQDQERWAEAEDLSSYALSVEPASGHAVHARAHVYYETGDHTTGLAWLDEWIRTRGPEANHRSHFSWHAALHELMQDDVEAVRRRYARELAPSVVQRQQGRGRQRVAALARPGDRRVDRRPARRRGADAGAGRVADRTPDAVRRDAQRRPPRRRRRRRRADRAGGPRRAERRPRLPRRRGSPVHRSRPGRRGALERRFRDADRRRRHDGAAGRQPGPAGGRRGHPRARPGDGRAHHRGRRAARPAPLPPLLSARRTASRRGVHDERVGQQLMALDGFSGVAVTTMISLAIVDLHVELVAGAAAWTAGWWLLREPGGSPH